MERKDSSSSIFLLFVVEQQRKFKVFFLSINLRRASGNPLQCSCLENPRDGGAWWAAIYGVTQSQT